ncbi:hypothetical protein ACFSQ0_05275 [Mesonia sediminis]|jgi:hypothetical protein|uniref:Uncharacterized protein n=2 Tax=Flavobacteriaceae TaxID=49546 RepID=A0A508A045_9FLAO|nr:hypothetical protein [Haloflavibacter putidus]TQD40285.1 hypothetical protein FKR84_03545 [Haloflavibacter putidus]
MKIKRRIQVHPTDIQNITGFSLRHSQRILKRLKEMKGKSKNQIITTQELADYLGIDLEIVQDFIDY